MWYQSLSETSLWEVFYAEIDIEINKCRAFSTLESQDIYASFQSAVIQVELEVNYSVV